MKILTYLFILLISFCARGQTIMNIYQNNGVVLQIPLSTIDSITYTVGSPGTLATLSTLSAANITASSAEGGGNISSNGGTSVTQHGVCWSTTQNPTTANSHTIDGTGIGSFSSTLSGLNASTTYYMRAYAINSAGTAYGNQVSFSTTSIGSGNIVSNPGPGIMFSGYNYPTIVLGNGQEWMSENLRTSTYANGDTILNVTIDTQFAAITTGSWCWYDNDPQYENIFGKLYNGYAMIDSRNVCPVGWHVPIESDWNHLIKYLDPTADTSFAYGYPSTIAGDLMKSVGGPYWFLNCPGNNQSGFSGVGSGYRDVLGSYAPFVSIRQKGRWWCATPYPVSSGPPMYFSRELYCNNGDVICDISYLWSAFSIRCLKD